MGGKSELGDNMDWSIQNTKAFIDVLYEKVKKQQLQGSTFKVNVWEEINNELSAAIGQNYGVNRLKGKYNRLRTLHREFSTLLARTGVTWDIANNRVNAPPEVWDDLFSKGKYYKQIKKNGFEYDYEMLGEIFNSSTATGKLSHASTREPPNSDEERQMEDDFIAKGVHISDSIDVDSDEHIQRSDEKRKQNGSPSRRHGKKTRSSRIDKLEDALSEWRESIASRNEATKLKAELLRAKVEKYKAQECDPYSIEICMDILEGIEDIPSAIYNKTLLKFKDSDWRRMFVKMSSSRRMEWLMSE